jgi:hypothetical protein
MDSELINLPSTTQDFNNVKNTILHKLLEDNIITKDQFNEYNNKRQIIVFKRSWFKYWWKIFDSTSKDGYCFRYINFEK